MTVLRVLLAVLLCAADAMPDCHTSTYLIGSDWKDRTLMAIMALSMGSMFYGMQLLR